MLLVRRRLYEQCTVQICFHQDLSEERHVVHVAVVISLWWGELLVEVRHQEAAEIWQLVKASPKPL